METNHLEQNTSVIPAQAEIHRRRVCGAYESLFLWATVFL